MDGGPQGPLAAAPRRMGRSINDKNPLFLRHCAGLPSSPVSSGGSSGSSPGEAAVCPVPGFSTVLRSSRQSAARSELGGWNAGGAGADAAWRSLADSGGPPSAFDSSLVSASKLLVTSARRSSIRPSRSSIADAALRLRPWLALDAAVAFALTGVRGTALQSRTTFCLTRDGTSGGEEPPGAGPRRSAGLMALSSAKHSEHTFCRLSALRLVTAPHRGQVGRAGASTLSSISSSFSRALLTARSVDESSSATPCAVKRSSKPSASAPSPVVGLCHVCGISCSPAGAPPWLSDGPVPPMSAAASRSLSSRLKSSSSARNCHFPGRWLLGGARKPHTRVSREDAASARLMDPEVSLRALRRGGAAARTAREADGSGGQRRRLRSRAVRTPPPRLLTLACGGAEHSIRGTRRRAAGEPRYEGTRTGKVRERGR